MRENVTSNRLIVDLKNIGLEPGDTVMIHASVKSIGWLVGGPGIILTAIQEVIGPEGTILMYVGWEDGPYTMERWSKEKKRTYFEECPPFDPRTSRATREWGILAETLRTWPGPKRSAHPDGSFCANGKNAGYLLARHAFKFGYGRNSPLAKLIELDGKVLLLGSPLSNVTLLHHSESMCKVENKPIVRYKAPVLRAGKRVWVEVEEYDTSSGIFPDYQGDCFNDIVTAYLKTQSLGSSKIGMARSYIFDARSLDEFGTRWLEDWAKRPRGDSE